MQTTCVFCLYVCLSVCLHVPLYSALYCAWWRIGRVDAFWPEGRKFESRSIGATKGPWANTSLAVACSSSACKLRHSVNCCGWERFWKAHAVRSGIEMDKCNTIHYVPEHGSVYHPVSLFALLHLCMSWMYVQMSLCMAICPSAHLPSSISPTLNARLYTALHLYLDVLLLLSFNDV